jgi:hypothetical protein
LKKIVSTDKSPFSTISKISTAMRTILLFAFPLFFLGYSYGQTICFTYDAAGNRIKRESTCGISERSNEATNAEIKTDAKTITGIVAPNPNSGSFEVRLEALPDETESAQFELYDSNGRLVSKWPLQGLNTQIDISDKPAGQYFLLLRSEKARHGQWLVVKE